MKTRSGKTAVARSLADAHPQSMLPCPICVASLRGENLAKHLSKVHPGAEESEGRDSPEVFEGKDRRLARELIVVLAVGMLFVFFPLILWTGGRLPDWAGVSIGVFVTFILTTSGLAAFDLCPARLELKETEAQLIYALGLRRRACALVGPLEVGRLWEYRPDPMVRSTEVNRHTKWDAGFFLRLRDGQKQITIGSRRGTAFRKHWAEGKWSNAKSTRFWDLTISPEEMVALEYALAARSLLELRAES